jgi:hypothetical protein
MLVNLCLISTLKTIILVTVSFLHFPIKKKWYALKQMGMAHSWLSKVPGCDFYKLMGSGAGKGFSIFPDFSVFCLLMKWKDVDSMHAFFDEHKEWLTYKSQASKMFRLDLKPSKVHGKWGGEQPFQVGKEETGEGRIVVLTRATIKKRFIPFFWSKVPKASRPVQDIPGHLFSKGVGEVPLLHQATVSVWESKAAMHSYAYEHDAHIKMIRMTREKGWYSEEMFAEFNLLNIEGDLW